MTNPEPKYRLGDRVFCNGKRRPSGSIKEVKVTPSGSIFYYVMLRHKEGGWYKEGELTLLKTGAEIKQIRTDAQEG